MSKKQLKCGVELATIFVDKIGTTFFPNLCHVGVLNLYSGMMDSLLNVGKALKTLRLGQIWDVSPRDYAAFEKLLGKHGSTLETLDFTNMPPLPNLCDLKISVSPELTDARIKPVPKIRFIFPSPNGRICYKEHFPRLQSRAICNVGDVTETKFIRR